MSLDRPPYPLYPAGPKSGGIVPSTPQVASPMLQLLRLLLLWRNYLTDHHHRLVSRSKSIAFSTMRRQEGRSVARRNAE